MAQVEEILGGAFRCLRCEHQGGDVQELSMSGTGFSRMFDVQPYRYAFVSCRNCGYTEVYNLDTLRGKDDLGSLMDILFAG